jgi:hypothetical protein
MDTVQHTLKVVNSWLLASDELCAVVPDTNCVTVKRCGITVILDSSGTVVGAQNDKAIPLCCS